MRKKRFISSVTEATKLRFVIEIDGDEYLTQPYSCCLGCCSETLKRESSELNNTDCTHSIHKGKCGHRWKMLVFHTIAEEALALCLSELGPSLSSLFLARGWAWLTISSHFNDGNCKWSLVDCLCNAVHGCSAAPNGRYHLL